MVLSVKQKAETSGECVENQETRRTRRTRKRGGEYEQNGAAECMEG